MALPPRDEIEDIAHRSGLTTREYCLKQIQQWEAMLEEVSEDYRGLDDDEFRQRLEEEADHLTDSE